MITSEQTPTSTGRYGDPGPSPRPRTPGWGEADGGWAPPPGPPVVPPRDPWPQPPSRGRGWVAALALAVVGAVAVAGAGYAVGRGPDDPDSSARVAASSTGDAVPAATAPGSEPVAAVADALAPAVVQIETRSGLGSGFVYDSDGLILTAAHVVAGTREVRVRVADGRSLEGQVVGSDSGSDVAVVRVEAGDLTAAPLADDASVEVGELAVAVGSPFGLDQTVTAGIVSAVGRAVRTPAGAISMIQTDAPINPGNSGGPLANREGQVVGINDSIRSDSGSNAGIGFAIPIGTARHIAERLVAGQPITNGYLGIGADDAEDGSGAQVLQVESDSPGGEAGIRPGDVIVTVGDTPIRSAADLVAAVRSAEPGSTLRIGVERQAENLELTATLGTAPAR